jgi:Flp pilus assembly protein TadD
VPSHPRLILAALAAATVAAGPTRRPPDPEAVEEARRPPPPERIASPRAIGHYLEAHRASRDGDAARAVEELRLAIAHDPESAELRYALALALAHAGRLDAAEAEALRAAELDGDGSQGSEAHVLLARIHGARRETEKAEAALRDAIRIQTALSGSGERADPRPWRILAELKLEAGEPEAAARVLEDAASRIPGDPAGFREMGRTLFERRDPAGAVRALRRAVEIDPADAEARRLLGRSFQALRSDAEAREQYLASLRLEPEDDETLLVLGEIALRERDLSAAREWFGRALRTAPDAPQARLRMALAWLDAALPADALATARDGIAEWGPEPRLKLAEGMALQDLRRWPEAAAAFGAVRPEAGELWFGARASQAHALARAGRYAEAERVLEEPLAAHPRDPRLLTTRAYVLERSGRSRQAEALLRRALVDLEKGGDDLAVPPVVEALAAGLSRAGRPDEAVEVLRGVLARRPRDPSLLYALGSAHERAGRVDAAVAQMRALVALDPDHADALNFIGYVYAEQGTRLDEAEELIRRALHLKPRSGHILDSLGWVRFRRGDFSGAIALLEQADALSGPDPTILDHLGDAYLAVSRGAEAAAAWRRALAALGEEDPADQVRLRSALERKLQALPAGVAEATAR